MDQNRYQYIHRDSSQEEKDAYFEELAKAKQHMAQTTGEIPLVEKIPREEFEEFEKTLEKARNAGGK